MRISCDKDDPGYPQWLQLGRPFGRADVFLDGELQKKVITADEENGFVERAKVDEKGNVIIDYGKMETIHEFQRGIVKIEIRPK